MWKDNNCKLDSKFRVLKLVSPVLLIGIYAIVKELMLIL